MRFGQGRSSNRDSCCCDCALTRDEVIAEHGGLVCTASRVVGEELWMLTHHGAKLLPEGIRVSCRASFPVDSLGVHVSVKSEAHLRGWAQTLSHCGSYIGVNSTFSSVRIASRVDTSLSKFSPLRTTILVCCLSW